MIKEQNYSKIFNHLCHIVALSKDGKVTSAIDNLVLTAFAANHKFCPSTVSQIISEIHSSYGLLLGETEIRSSVDRLFSAGSLIQDNKTKIYLLDSKTKGDIENRIQEAYSLEQRVKEEWFQSIKEINPQIPEKEMDQLWKCLQSYMAKAFRRHGVQTIQLLNPTIPFDDEARKHLSTYLDEAMRECYPGIAQDTSKNLIRLFFKSSTPKRTKYLVQLLDGTFTFFALTVDKETSLYLKKSIKPLAIFLDTNFIFGILDLHSNPFNDISFELLEVIKKHKLPFNIYYHEETLNELRRTIAISGERLRKHKWSQSLSRAAVVNNQLSGIELRYHEKNAQTPIDPEIFVSKYEHITELLRDQGFKIYRVSNSNTLKDEQRFRLVAEYEAFVSKYRPNRPKPYEALNHDVAVWQTVMDLRKKGDSPLDAGAFFLTADYNFYSFDWQNLRKKESLGAVILPNQLMQILRPFIPATEDFDQHFVETFAIPEFRIVGSNYSTTCSKILSFLSTYNDLKEETAIRILTNEVLINQLRTVDENSEGFKELIESSVIADNDRLTQNNKALKKEKEALESNLENKTKEADQTNEQLTSIKEFLQRVEQNATANETLKDNTIQGLKNELDSTKLFIKRLVIGLVIGVVGLLLIIVLPLIFKWQWLNEHPNRLGLYVSSGFIILGFAWCIFDKKNRNFAFGSMVLGAALVMVTLLDK